jgi:hypothetical protein
VKELPEDNKQEPINLDELPELEHILAALPNPELLSVLDLALLELEKRLLRYAQAGEQLLEMADEGLLLAIRAKARLGQALSSAQHTEGHLQIVGVGEWKPTSSHPGWDSEPRLDENHS